MPDAAIGRCGTCRHWDQEVVRSDWRVQIRLRPLPGEDPYGDEIEERQRQAEALYGECQKIDLLQGYEQHDPDSLPLAFCKDGSDYRANLYTQAEFGCPLWEHAETAPSTA